MKVLRTDVSNYFKDAGIDLKSIEGAMDISFENVGASVVRITTLSGFIDLSPGDPMLTWGGYDGYYRNDVLKFIFVGGTGNLVVYINKHINQNNC